MEATRLPGKRLRMGLRSLLGARPSTAVEYLDCAFGSTFPTGGGVNVGPLFVKPDLAGTAGGVRAVTVALSGAGLLGRGNVGGGVSSVAMEATLLPGNLFRTGLRSLTARPSTAVDCLRSFPADRLSLKGGEKVGLELLDLDGTGDIGLATDSFLGTSGDSRFLLNLDAADFFCLLGEGSTVAAVGLRFNEAPLEALRCFVVVVVSVNSTGECDLARLVLELVVVDRLRSAAAGVGEVAGEFNDCSRLGGFAGVVSGFGELIAGVLAGLRSFMDFVRSGKDFRLSDLAAAGGRVGVTRDDWGLGGTKISILESSLSSSSSSSLLLTSIITEDRPRPLVADLGLLTSLFRCHFTLWGFTGLEGKELNFLGCFCGW